MRRRESGRESSVKSKPEMTAGEIREIGEASLRIGVYFLAEQRAFVGRD